MGSNSVGQLGDGTRTDRKCSGAGVSGVAVMAAGGAHSLYVKTDGTLWATGFNGYGQLGYGATADRRTPVQVAMA